MPHIAWADLPSEARTAVEERADGTVLRARSAGSGTTAALAATLQLHDGRTVFCKGSPVDDPGAWTLGNEARMNAVLDGFAPLLLWETKTDGWHLLGFEHVPGRSADLSPGSADLPRLADFLTAAGCLSPPTVPVRRLGPRWSMTTWRDAVHSGAPMTGWEAEHAGTLAELEALTPDLVTGEAVQHTDMTPHNFLVADGGVRLTDWSWPAIAVPWMDTALLVHRMIAAGHTATAAEQWAGQVPAWCGAEEKAITAVAVTVLGLWQTRSRTSPAPYRTRLASAASTWVQHRLGAVPRP